MENTEYLLAEMRCARLRAQLMIADIDAIGVALKSGLISETEALAQMQEVGLLRYVAPINGIRKQDLLPEGNGKSEIQRMGKENACSV